MFDHVSPASGLDFCISFIVAGDHFQMRFQVYLGTAMKHFGRL